MSDDVRSLLAEAAASLGGELARLEAELLLAHALERPRAWLYAHGDASVSNAARAAFDRALAARVRGEPMAYLLRRRDFWSLELVVTNDVLIPRAETERLVELALAAIDADCDVDVADLGTGSGAIALAIAQERPRARVLATDASAAALAVARANAERLGLSNVSFAQDDWCAALGTRAFDVVVSNPPYIAAGDSHLAVGDLRFEPSAALASGADGLDAIRAILANVPRHLRHGGRLFIEHGFDQGERVRALFERAGFADVATERDLEERDRVTHGQLRK